MKKTILTAFFVAAMCAAMAQHVTLGPTLGFGHTWFSTNDNNNGNYNNRFQPLYSAGLKLVYSSRMHLGFSADAKYSSEGGTAGVDKNNETVMRANFIRVPLQVIYFFNEFGNHIRPKISVGPSFGFLVGGETKTYVGGNQISDVKTDPYLDNVDVGANIAAGINFRVARGTWLNTDITYYHGFTNLAPNNATGDVKQSNIALNVGLLFPLR